jgi:hypothetical protein
MLLRRGRLEDALKARTLLQEAKARAREVNIPAVEARIDELLASAHRHGRNQGQAGA